MAIPSLRFDRLVGRFRRSDGRFVATGEARRAIRAYLNAVGRETNRLADELRSGRLSLEGWRLEMQRLIKSTHLNMARVACGGRSGMDAAGHGRVGQIVRREYAYLERWVQQIVRGWVLDGRLPNRAKQYADAGWDTFEQVEAEEMLKRAMNEEKNMLTQAEHCRGQNSCIEQTERGWVPIGSLVPVGRRRCLRGCQCYKIYRRAA